jgi:hypothetical protein
MQSRGPRLVLQPFKGLGRHSDAAKGLQSAAGPQLPWRSTGCCARPPPTRLSAPASNRAAMSPVSGNGPQAPSIFPRKVDFSCFGYHPELELRLMFQEKWVLGGPMPAVTTARPLVPSAGQRCEHVRQYESRLPNDRREMAEYPTTQERGHIAARAGPFHSRGWPVWDRGGHKGPVPKFSFS